MATEQELANWVLKVNADISGFRAQMQEMQTSSKQGSDAVLQQTKSFSDSLKGEIDKIGDHFKEMGKSLALSALVIKGLEEIKKFVGESVRAIDEEITTIARLKNVMGEGGEAIAKYAKEQEKVTRFSHDEVLASAAVLSAQVRNEEQLKRLLPVVEDYATATGTSMESASTLFLRAIMSNTASLGRYNIGITGAVDTQERMNSIIEKSTAHWGGQAKAVADLGAGPLVKMQNQYSEVAETFGERLLPFLKTFADFSLNELPTIIGLFDLLGRTLNFIGNGIIQIFSSVKTIIDGVATVILNILQSLIYTWGMVFSALDKIPFLTKGMKEGITEARKFIQDAHNEVSGAGDIAATNTVKDHNLMMEAGENAFSSGNQKIPGRVQAAPDLPGKNGSGKGSGGEKPGDVFAANIEASLSMHKAMVEKLLADLDETYKAAGISLDEYYKKKAELINHEHDDEKKALDLQIAHAADSAKIAQLRGKVAVNEIERQKDLAKNTAEYNDALRKQNELQGELTQKLESLTAKANSGYGKSGTPVEQMTDKHTSEVLAQNKELAAIEKKLRDSGNTEEQIATKTSNYKKALWEEELRFRKALVEEADAYQLERAKTMTGAVGNLFGQMYELGGKQSKELFEAQKLASAATAAMNVAEAATKAWAQGGIYGAVLAAVTVAAGAFQIANIMSQQYSPPKISKAATGGYMRGPSHDQGGIPIEVEGGEYIHQKSAVGYYGTGVMEAINQRAIPRGMLAGFGAMFSGITAIGKAAGGGSPASSAMKVQTSIVNFVDPSLMNRYLSSAEGKASIINVLSERAFEVKRVLGVA